MRAQKLCPGSGRSRAEEGAVLVMKGTQVKPKLVADNKLRPAMQPAVSMGEGYDEGKDAELTASADSVRAYLKQIGKVPLLNAEQEIAQAAFDVVQNQHDAWIAQVNFIDVSGQARAVYGLDGSQVQGLEVLP